ncbi:ELM2 and SANT domain-containing protein 1 isoform X1 [Scleropages formosus]|nr:ELM2 and SANT domain-containing protein 1-like isoform X1 [Scleropages formosus]XP_029114161.1 ELM2 and SANT domain-containing protein 1-like isoform X1 [Scleropages formosus]XP_029114162.1 ELM2 and SANT domain-containing protein 1-like isoform X1 [Scleropages formosus]XP_029114164.1 ELM2 and SANT domain-containing protein 1-like isoform X1 [Scleropages formosus]
MSLPPQQKGNTKRAGKRITFFNDQDVVTKEPMQHVEGPFFGLGSSSLEPGHNEAMSQASSSEAPHMYLNSVIFSPEKGEQSRGHYQQTVPMKWAQQDSSRQASWSQGIPITSWGQNFAPYLGGVSVNDSRMQAAFLKPLHEGPLLQPSRTAAEKQLPDPPDAYRDVADARGTDWEAQQQAVASVHHGQRGQLQLLPQGPAPGMSSQPLATSHATGSSVLQPFQVAFGQPKQHLPPGYYQVFQCNRTLPNLNYGGQPKPANQFRQQEQQQQTQQHQEFQQHQEQKHPQQEMQPKLQQQQGQQENEQFLDYLSHTTLPSMHVNLHLQQHPSQPLESSTKPEGPQIQFPAETLDPDAHENAHRPSSPPQPSHVPQPASQRSRHPSEEGVPPAGDNPFLVLVSHPEPRKGSPERGGVHTDQAVPAAPTGVIQSTRRKRRVSHEVNLETLAQKASEMESLPSHASKESEKAWNPSVAPAAPQGGAVEGEGANAKRPRDDSMLPLVIPVSVPVRQPHHLTADQDQAKLPGGWAPRALGLHDSAQNERKPTVIVTRRRSLRSSLSESSGQSGGGEEGKEEDGKSAKKRGRPRPGPLFIPAPKPVTFITPPVYSNITPYQSHLRSPVRLGDNAASLPPYTPPPILSPVREGSGLYFSTFISSGAAGASQVLPLPVTPKSAARSLLRSSSCDITPPVLSAVNEATPVSIEPRINVGIRYQAEVPDLRDLTAAQRDQHQAELVWAPLPEPESKSAQLERVDDLTRLACSSALCGGGTNQELAMHCLYECKGDILGALTLLLLKNPIFSKTHPLGDYHYSGSDSWTSAEKKGFNKGIAVYKKDFFMVQKMVSTKTVAQCVEFYYSYKKQVKIGRNGTLIYGDRESPQAFAAEVEVDVKSSQRLESRKEGEDKSIEGSCDRRQDCSPSSVSKLLRASDSAGAVLVLRSREETREEERTRIRPPSPPPPPPPPSVPAKPRSDSGKRNGTTAASRGHSAPEGEFPCKKCGRVFYKVKSRSAHMKSHAEQEKKAAALRQKEAEERAAAEAAAAAMASRQNGTRERSRDNSTEESSEEEEDADDEDWH